MSRECSYEYYVGSWLSWTKTYRFSGRTHSPNDLGPTNIVVLADWGGGELAIHTKYLLLQQLGLSKVDALLHGGDFAYDLDDFNGMVGDYWFNMVQPVAASVPYMTLPGNHETGRNYSHYRNKFKMPVNKDNEGSGFFYSFNIGRAHYVMFNTETYFDSDARDERETALNWLIEHLQEANTSENREIRPWIIMLTHRNLYCSVDWKKPFPKNGDCEVNPVRLRAALEEIIHEAAVDLFIQAHVHLYERNTPIYHNLTVRSDHDSLHTHLNTKATVYITNGNAGNVLGHNDPVVSTLQIWSVHSSEEFGYGRVVVYNTTHLYYEQFGAESRRVIDYVWLIKDRPRF